MRSLMFGLGMLCATGASCMAGLHYTVLPLTAEGGPIQAVKDINNVGDILALDQHLQPILLSNHRKATPLISSNGMPIPDDELNDRRMVTGDTVAGADSRVVAGIWKNGRVTALPSPPRSDAVHVSEAEAINNEGIVAGLIRSAGAFHAAVWDASGLQQLPDTGQSFARGINEAGEVVGIDETMDSSGVLHGNTATVWRNQILTHLQISGAQSSVATSINDHSVIAGVAEFGDTERAFRWTNGEVQWLQPLPGESSSSAFAINNQGMVLGVGEDPMIHPILWTHDGSPIDLLKFFPAREGWSHVQPLAINDAGWIVGNAELHGQFRGFEMKPTVIPLPPAFWACIGALPLFVLACRWGAAQTAHSND